MTWDVAKCCVILCYLSISQQLTDWRWACAWCCHWSQLPMHNCIPQGQLECGCVPSPFPPPCEVSGSDTKIIPDNYEHLLLPSSALTFSILNHTRWLDVQAKLSAESDYGHANCCPHANILVWPTYQILAVVPVGCIHWWLPTGITAPRNDAFHDDHSSDRSTDPSCLCPRLTPGRLTLPVCVEGVLWDYNSWHDSTGIYVTTCFSLCLRGFSAGCNQIQLPCWIRAHNSLQWTYFN